MTINRRQLLGGGISLGLVALFRPKRAPSMLVELPEDITEADILEEYEAYPAAIDMAVIAMTAFRPRRLVVPESIAPLWVIENIAVNARSQFAEPGHALSATMFRPDQIDMDMYCDPVAPNVEVRMRVRRSGPVNVRLPPETFRAAFIGSAGEAGYGRMVALPISSDPWQVIP